MFTYAGVSTYKGKVKARFANDNVTRAKKLQRSGHSDIRMESLNGEMNKHDAAKFLLAHKAFQDAEAQAALTHVLNTKAPKTAVAQIKAKTAELAQKEVEAEYA